MLSIHRVADGAYNTLGWAVVENKTHTLGEFKTIEQACAFEKQENALRARMAMERRIVRHLIRTAKAHGYAIAKVSDGEEWHMVTTERAAMAVIFSVDEANIYFKHPDEPKAHCAVIVLGNDGYDAIADSSQGGKWDAVMQACDAYADKLAETI